MGTTELSEDYVFLTKTHDHGTTDAIQNRIALQFFKAHSRPHPYASLQDMASSISSSFQH